MKNISVMHIADMHLGTQISQFDAKKNITRMFEIQSTALSVLKSASDYDVVLLPGDVFDLSDTPEHIADMFLNAVASCSDTRFFYSCGNHDPFVTPVVDYCVRNCPPNLHIFGFEQVECITVEELGVRVYGISFGQNHTPEALLKFCKRCDPSYINLLCVHGVIGNVEGEPYNPISISDVEACGFDYMALGHVHSFSGIQKSGTLTYAYSGNTEPRRFDECGAKGIICGTVAKNDIDLHFKPVCKRQYVEKKVDISDFHDYSSLICSLSDLADNRDYIYHYKLEGINNIASSLNTELIERHIDVFGSRITDFTRRPYEISDFSEELTLKGECARETIRLCQNSDEKKRDLYQKACHMVFDLLDKRSDSNDR